MNKKWMCLWSCGSDSVCSCKGFQVGLTLNVSEDAGDWLGSRMFRACIQVLNANPQVAPWVGPHYASNQFPRFPSTWRGCSCFLHCLMSGMIAWCGNENWLDLTTGRWSASENRLDLRVVSRGKPGKQCRREIWFYVPTKNRCGVTLCGLVKIGYKYIIADGRPYRWQQAGALFPHFRFHVSLHLRQGYQGCHVYKHMLSAFGQSLWLA